MQSLNRRHLLASGAGLAVCGVAGEAFAQAAAHPPVASIRPVTETLQGVSVTDNYRWMENSADPEWMPYLLGQDAYARSLLAAIPGREALAAKISAKSGAVAAVNAVQAAGPYVFTEVRPVGANTFKLYVREGWTGADRLLIDPDTLATGATHYSLDYWVASPDGVHVAYATSPAGSEASVVRILETATGKVLPDALDRAQLGSPSWAPDGTGLFLSRLREGTKHGDPDHYLNSVNWFHRLGDPPSADVKVLANGLDPAVPMTPIEFPFVAAQVGSDQVIGVPANGVQNEFDMFIAPLAGAVVGKPVWTRVCSRSDNVTGFALFGPDLYLLTHDKAPRFKIVKTSAAAPSLATAKVVVPESAVVLKSLAVAKDGVYVAALDAGVGKVMRIGADGAVTSLRLPFAGAVNGLTADPMRDGCWFFMTSWVKPEVICRGRPDGTVLVTDLAPKPDIDISPYDSQEVMVRARDGVEAPLSIIFRKDVRRDGSAPLYLEAYGAYGISIDPGFAPRFLPWLDLGGVWAVAHVRGGGELGEDWHKAGQQLTKPHSWRDAIDCATYLIDQKWTSKAKLAVEGTSAGGIMVSRFLTERPDLLAVAIDRVGVSDAMRAEFSENGPDNVPEFGTVKEPDGFRGLYEMDGYQHVKDGVAYPAVMLTTGLTDPRVANWEAGKMTARLQKATSSGKPVILRVEKDAGHGMGSTRKQRDDETADTYAFILWQTGDPRFQPKG